MFQGQVGLLVSRPNRTDVESCRCWIQKLRTDDGKVNLYRLNVPEEQVMFNLKDVDESLTNAHPDLPYEIKCVLPVELQLEKTDLDTYKLEDEIAQGQVMERVAKLKEDERVLTEKIKDLLESRNKISKIIDDMVSSCSSGEGYMYAYGKHNASAAEFCWRVPEELREKVKPGCTIIVETKYGRSEALVTRVETTHYFIPHKVVLGVAGY